MEQQNQQPNQPLPQTSLDEVKREKNKRIKISLLALATVLIVVGGVSTFVLLNKSTTGYPLISSIPQDLASCTTDDQCVIVPYKDCCASKRVVNKKYEQEYLNNPEWQLPSKEQLELCKTIRCTDATVGFNSVECRNNTCVLSRSEDTTVGWQTYRNDEFGFEFKYPPYFHLSLAHKDPGSAISLIDTRTNGDNRLVKGPNAYIAIEIKDGNLEEEIKKNQKNWHKKEDILVGGVAAQKLSSTIPDTEFLTGYFKTDIYIPKGNKIIHWNFYYPSQDTRLLDQILSTFRFIGQKMKQADDQNSCEKQGGKWQKAGAIQESMCIFTYADGGKKCTSSDECEGDCIVTQDSQTTGFCKQNTNPFGCFSTIESVKKGNGILCRD